MFEPDAPEQGQPDEPLRRPRGRHARRAAPAADGWRARAIAAAAPALAWLEPRLTTVGAWLFERRLHVLIVSATVATIAMFGGAFAFISATGAPRHDDTVAEIGDAPRPTSTDPGSPSSYSPILPSPRPTPPPTVTPTPTPGADPADPGAGASIDPAPPPPEPTTDTRNGRPDPPGHTNKPGKP